MATQHPKLANFLPASCEQEAPINFDLIAERPGAQQRALGIGHDCYYTKIKRKLWPALVKDGRMSYGYRHERELLSAAIATGKSDVEIRDLVSDIEASRPKIFARLRAAFDAVVA